MTDSDVARAVRTIVERVAGPGRTPVVVAAETRLHEGFWLDSVETLEVILACEREFDIAFEASRDLTPEALETIGSLVDLVCTRLGRRGGHHEQQA